VSLLNLSLRGLDLLPTPNGGQVRRLLANERYEMHINGLSLSPPWQQSNDHFAVDIESIPLKCGSLGVMGAFLSSDTESIPKTDLEVAVNELKLINVGTTVSISDNVETVTVPASEVVIDTDSSSFQVTVQDVQGSVPVVVNLVGLNQNQVPQITFDPPASPTYTHNVTLGITGGEAKVLVSTLKLPLAIVAVPGGAVTSKVAIEVPVDSTEVELLQPAVVTAHQLTLEVPSLSQVESVSVPSFRLQGDDSSFSVRRANAGIDDFLSAKVQSGLVGDRSTGTVAHQIKFTGSSPKISVGILSTFTFAEGTDLGSGFSFLIDFVEGYALSGPIVAFSQSPQYTGQPTLVFDSKGVTITDLDGSSVPRKLPSQVLISGIPLALANALVKSTPPAGYKFEVSPDVSANLYQVSAVSSVYLQTPTDESLFQTGAVIGVVFSALILVVAIVAWVVFFMKRPKEGGGSSDSDSLTSSDLTDAYGDEHVI
jgi:hypothetical protein